MNNKNLFNKNLYYLGHNTMQEIKHPSYQHYIEYVKQLEHNKNPIKPEYKEPLKPFMNFNTDYNNRFEKYKEPSKPFSKFHIDYNKQYEKHTTLIKPFINFTNDNTLIHPGDMGPLNNEMLLVSLDNKFKQNKERQNMKHIVQEDFNILFHK